MKLKAIGHKQSKFKSQQKTISDCNLNNIYVSYYLPVLENDSAASQVSVL